MLLGCPSVRLSIVLIVRPLSVRPRKLSPAAKA